MIRGTYYGLGASSADGTHESLSLFANSLPDLANKGYPAFTRPLSRTTASPGQAKPAPTPFKATLGERKTTPSHTKVLLSSIKATLIRSKKLLSKAQFHLNASKTTLINHKSPKSGTKTKLVPLKLALNQQSRRKTSFKIPRKTPPAAPSFWPYLPDQSCPAESATIATTHYARPQPHPKQPGNTDAPTRHPAAGTRQTQAHPQRDQQKVPRRTA